MYRARVLRIACSRFVDEHGRTVVLRGVNLGGSSKVPRVPDGATWRRDALREPRAVSFVGRPFPLEEADEHLRRLHRWGLRTLRLLTTWEAIEHAGPGQYDAAYLEYFEAVARRAGELGFHIFIDFHQDVWSRFSGGDGAPGWTLEAAGFQLDRLHEAGAAFVHGGHGEPLPKMIWPSNVGKLACATMFTLFFGGDVFAPRASVDGVPVQRFLQERFFGAVEQVVRRLAGAKGVFGWDVLNEPSAGYIGREDLTRPFGPVQVGPLPSPLESFALGDGKPRTVGWWKRDLLGPRVERKVQLNPRGVRAWRDGARCVWRDHGVWGDDARGEPVLLRPDHFSRVDGRAVDFADGFYKPFLKAALGRIRALAPDAVFFVEGEPQRGAPSWSAADGANVAFAPHWYDGVVLFLKDFWPFLGVDFATERPVLGAGRIRKSYAAQLRRFTGESHARLGGLPVLLGELGIAFDLSGKRAYRTADFSKQVRAMDRTLTAVEDALLHATLWNYTADNTNARGDQWNDEDLSIYSVDQREDPADPDSGGRALDAVVRPYPLAVAGTLTRYGFDLRARRFELVVEGDARVTQPTELYVPERHYPGGVAAQVSSGRTQHDATAQRLDWWHGGGEQRLVLTPQAPSRCGAGRGPG